VETACIFCEIAQGRSEADVVLATDDAIWFRDISPKAPVHVVVAPRKHIASLATAQSEDSDVLGSMLIDSARVAREAGLEAGGYRVITNIGSDAGQAVEHIHFHILGGESLGPLRC